jgi:phospholipase C
MFCRSWLAVFAVALALALCGCQGLVKGIPGLTVNVAGAGTGMVTSAPNGIDCPSTCTANFQGSTQVALTATPAPGFTFAGWSGGCTGTSATCTVSGSTVTATFNASLQSINHIIFLAQENRSFDTYFGALREYWAQNNIPDQPFDGLPQFNPPANPAAAPTNPGCNPATSTPTVCHADPATNDVGPPVQSFHFNTVCVENPSPSWNESHADWNASDPVAPPPPTLDGFVRTAANDARQVTPQLHDVAGMRAMGYYDGGDLNYYYFMASNFATSDAWFSPVMTRTPPNREYLIGGTSHGYVYAVGANPPADTPLIPTPPIFEELQNAGISWKIYVNPGGTPCTPTDSACLYQFTYVKNFTYGPTIKNTPSLLANIVPISQFAADLQNGTLPQVAQIEPASNAGLDEHPSDTDHELFNVQKGANYVAGLINGLMGSSSWSTSIFVLTFDESGGFFDHVSPAPAVSPDGIAPSDLFAGDTCSSGGPTGLNCDFTFTGYRVPLVVISPYVKKNFVSHAANADGTGVDTTAILKLIETRFGLHSLTARDADQLDMSQEFLDFTQAPFKTPPTTPAQNTSGACYLDHLP